MTPPNPPASTSTRTASVQCPAVFDELIAKKEMPVTTGVFVMHGWVNAQDKALDCFNRSYEYDGLGDSYARFLLDDLLFRGRAEEGRRRPAPLAITRGRYVMTSGRDRLTRANAAGSRPGCWGNNLTAEPKSFRIAARFWRRSSMQPARGR